MRSAYCLAECGRLAIARKREMEVCTRGRKANLQPGFFCCACWYDLLYVRALLATFDRKCLLSFTGAPEYASPASAPQRSCCFSLGCR